LRLAMAGRLTIRVLGSGRLRGLAWNILLVS
jgi:hypothetical protein